MRTHEDRVGLQAFYGIIKKVESGTKPVCFTCCGEISTTEGIGACIVLCDRDVRDLQNDVDYAVAVRNAYTSQNIQAMLNEAVLKSMGGGEFVDQAAENPNSQGYLLQYPVRLAFENSSGGAENPKASTSAHAALVTRQDVTGLIGSATGRAIVQQDGTQNGRHIGTIA
jgi:hypothetical protein